MCENQGLETPLSSLTTAERTAMSRSRPSFLDQEPPPGYVAGIGRGAIGFASKAESAQSSYRRPSRLNEGHASGNRESGLQQEAALEQFKDHDEDKEADEIYAALDIRLTKKTAKQPQRSADSDKVKNTQDYFVDLKRQLAGLTESDWMSIPDAGDLTRRNKRQRSEYQQQLKTYAAPDSLLPGARVDLMKLTEEREKLLGHQLDANFQPDTQKQVASTEQYLAELESSTSTAELEAPSQDVTKARKMLAAYRRSDPKQPQGWIASAKLEERVNRFHSAKAIIDQGCQECPRDEDIWLENIRLNSSDVNYCKIIVAQAIQFNSKSERLWLTAIELEGENFNKLRVVRKALRNIPKSEKLWILAVRLEPDTKEVVKILSKATQILPTSPQLWKLLIKNQGPDEIRTTIQEARKSMPHNVDLCILEADIKLQATTDESKKLQLLSESIKSVSSDNKPLTFNQWLVYITNAELDACSPKTIMALVGACFTEFATEVQVTEVLAMLQTVKSESKVTKLSVCRCLALRDPSKLTFWSYYIDLCRNEGECSHLYETWETLLKGVTMVKKYPAILLMYSKEIWKMENDEVRALSILDKGIAIKPDHLAFWNAKLKLLLTMRDYETAESTLMHMKDSICFTQAAGRDRLIRDYVIFLCFRGNHDGAVGFLNSMLSKDPENPQLYLLLSRVYSETSHLTKALDLLSSAVKKLPSSDKLWIQLAYLQEHDLNTIKARSTLELGQLKNSSSIALYEARAELEDRLGNREHARLLVQEGIRKFPKSPELWVLNIRFLARKSLRKTMFQDALKNTDSHGTVLVEIGKLFYIEKQYEMALKWFERASETFPRLGDGWAWYYQTLSKLGKDTSGVLRSAEEREPDSGKLWDHVCEKNKTLYALPSDIIRLCRSEIERGAWQ
ncbi:ABL100Wp [Eremothecium gossypii ATCC 10895]|uniref:ABL100Wp n=1 Tax=Eremothecium gossypii (strain ATCC 10895 / CBS 109.51 / FGSC 9923 / NRRL Y-1056) TaxID=284811 RepID=Q75DX3_EREGS|nr:ABL100Wp [Eremothecium gossypii ATCC 10895]AAS50671.1 ABL100Wp [Eremothecium gossypii ATCC 10895]